MAPQDRLPVPKRLKGRLYHSAATTADPARYTALDRPLRIYGYRGITTLRLLAMTRSLWLEIMTDGRLMVRLIDSAALESWQCSPQAFAELQSILRKDFGL